MEMADTDANAERANLLMQAGVPSKASKAPCVLTD
jgi:hypothetical protein